MTKPGESTDPGTELAMQRTGMSFQRTRMSADRTLMAVIRTSLSLISFGFTIAQVFTRLEKSEVLHGAHAARNFGVALVSLGIVMLVFGILYHVQFTLGLRRTREEMARENLLRGETRFPPSFTLIVAIILLTIGLSTIVSLVFHVGPFG